MVHWPCRWRRHESLVSLIFFLFPAMVLEQRSLTKEEERSVLTWDTVTEKQDMYTAHNEEC